MALAVVSLTWITMIEHAISIDYNVLCFVFFGGISGYNFVKYFGLAKFHHRSLANWIKYIQVFSFFSFLAMIFFAFKLQINTLLCISALGLITFFYAIPFLPKRFFRDIKHNLRSIGGLKVYLIGLVWSGVTVFVPVINNNHPLDADVFLTALQRYVFIIILMLPFEIRDLKYDSLRLSTIPQKIGVKNTKIMGVALLFLFGLIEFFKDEMTLAHAFVLCVVTLVTLIFLIFAKTSRGKYYTAFWIEGLPILWLILLLIFY